MAKCVRCGTCRSVCPVFEVVKSEGSSPRGKINLIYALLEDKVKLKEISKYLYMCTLCEACENICPNKVSYKAPLLKVRELINKKGLLDIKKKIQVEIVKHKNLLKLGSKLQYIFENFLKDKKLKTSLLLRLPLNQFIPKLSPVFFLEDQFFKKYKKAKNYLEIFDVKEDFEKYIVLPKKEKPKKEVLFFVGCALNYFFVDIALDTLYILTNLGYKVIIPKNQVCCGASAYFSGLKEDFEDLKKQNETIFKSYTYDFVISACATGNAILNKVYKVKSHLISEVLYKELKNKELFYKYAAKLAYHYPCHFVRGMKLSKNIIQSLFEKVKNVSLLSWEKEDSCCGMAGSFKISYPEVSDNILKLKMRNLQKYQPEILLTECPGCLMQLSEGIEKYINKPMEIKHLSTFFKEVFENSF